MNIKFNLGSVTVKAPEVNVEVEVKDISYEVTDMSLIEYAQVMKIMFTEGTNFMKEVKKAEQQEHDFMINCDIKRDNHRIAMDLRKEKSKEHAYSATSSCNM